MNWLRKIIEAPIVIGVSIFSLIMKICLSLLCLFIIICIIVAIVG